MTLRRATAALLGATAVLAALAGCAPGGIVTESTATSETTTDPDAPLAAFYGDSYTLGTGASADTARWSTRIAVDRGWREFNPSVNGLGFVNNRTGRDLPSEIIEQSPDILFVTMGLNDNFSYDARADDIRQAIRDDLTRLDGELPDARIIVVEPFWYTDDRPESVETIIGWVRESADEIGAEWIPDASRWIEGHPEWMADDGLHPNDEGYAEMTRRMDEALVELGL